MDQIEQKTAGESQCRKCGAVLKFKPGSVSHACLYCGDTTTFDTKEDKSFLDENDFDHFITNQLSSEARLEVATVKCTACGASTTLKAHITSDTCPFCSTPLVLANASTSTLLKPKALLPFKIDQDQAVAGFKKWLMGLWFAPNDLKKYAQREGQLQGLYIPYWTYDAKTQSQFSGERGDAYYVTDSRGKRIRNIRWSSISGETARDFDDVLVMASHSLPWGHARNLEPWDLAELTSFDENYLTGFKTESYQVDIVQGLPLAKQTMHEVITRDVKTQIGGDEQRILQLSTEHSDVTFKHILLPIWISAYRYKSKVYRFLVNGRSGETQGERPWSVVKIVLTALLILAVVLAGSYFENN